ncbi:MAG: hypothetical protein VX320_06190 [Candidatus Thermoplasmatota archaeon]|nr:hypothetical protein [Candidatus Thermoplasmatota archaeon]
MPPVKTWIAIGALVALILIPICWKFWKGWDRPSRAAKAEMQRRIRERDVRETFLREDAKARELERVEAQRELSRKKAQAPPPVEKGVLNSAFGNLGVTDSTGTVVLDGSTLDSKEKIVTPTENVDKLVNQLDVEGIDDDIIPEAAPVAVQLRAESSSDDIKWDNSQEKDDWSEVEWSND